MPPNATRPRSPLWFVVLGLACEEPMHPYRMQTLMKQRGKDQIANFAQRNSVYQTIEALHRAGYIASQGTSRDDRRPERTVYEATEEGRRALRAWVRAGISSRAREFPEFPAALSTLYGLEGADDLRGLLAIRAEALSGRLRELEVVNEEVPRLFLLETEYLAVMLRAELAWVRGVMADLGSGQLAFPNVDEILAIPATAGRPSDDAVRRIAAEMGGAAAEGPAHPNG
ncbi:MAG: PadR family transcriptional regulator [bacterium]